jgi:hypothetical protein
MALLLFVLSGHMIYLLIRYRYRKAISMTAASAAVGRRQKGLTTKSP